jgi:A/G-specific adenine glycosylase
VRHDRRVTETGERPAAITTALQDSILAWYERARRDLPFRATRDPYAVLVSETMAQQTQAARAGEAWTGFMAAWPTPVALAAATPADVLRAWQGLGYNRRALNLWRAARRIVEVHDGEVPADLVALRALPGVGPYTARAIGALAFGMAVGAVDTNVRRVLGRIVAGDGTALGATETQRVADAAVPPDRPGDWTHAVMDLGATVCRPRNPDCGRCPARAWCRYAATVRDGTAAGAGPKPAVPFPTTSRWLRGRIVDRLRDAPGNAWTIIDGPIGGHDHDAVAIAIEALARDGVVELDGSPADAADNHALPRRVRLRTT